MNISRLFLLIAAIAVTFSFSPAEANSQFCESFLSAVNELNPLIQEIADLLHEYENTPASAAHNPALRNHLLHKMREFEITMDKVKFSEGQKSLVWENMRRRQSELRDFNAESTAEDEARKGEDQSFYTFDHIKELDSINSFVSYGGTLGDWSANGRYLAYGYMGIVKVFDTTDWKQVGFFKGNDITGASPEVGMIKFSPDVKTLYATFGYSLYVLKLQDLFKVYPESLNYKDHLMMQTGPAGHAFSNAALDISRNRILGGSSYGVFEVKLDGGFVVYPDTGDAIKNLEVSKNVIPPSYLLTDDRAEKMTLSPDGKLLAVFGRSKNKTLGVYNVDTWTINPKIPALAKATAATFSPDGKVLAVIQRGFRITLVDVSSGKIMKHLFLGKAKRYLLSLTFSNDGRAVIAGGITGREGDHARIMIWHLPESLPSEDLPFTSGDSIDDNRPKSVFFSPDGENLVSTGSLLRTRVWKKTAVGKTK